VSAPRAVDAPAGPADVAGLLAPLPLLADLSADELRALARRAEHVTVAAGHVVMEEGTPGDGFVIVVRGELVVSRRDGAGEIVLGLAGPGEFLGEMSLIESVPRSATVRAAVASELLVLRADAFHALLAGSPAAALTILRTFVSRLRSTEAALLQQARLVSLGTLAAGLMHELNNPAAAVARGADQLGAAHAELDRCAARIARLGLAAELAERLPAGGMPPVAAPAGGPAAAADEVGDALNAAGDELAAWLEERRTPAAVRLAQALAGRGWTVAGLDDVTAGLAPEPAAAAVAWLAARCEVALLAEELGAAAGAISELVGAVRAHAAPGPPVLRQVDVVQALERALVVLRGRLGPGIEVVRDLPPGLPPVEAHGAELNQVWANLIDNAARAMGGAGRLELRARGEADGVRVEVADAGAGIPPEALPRVFDPFFTTRPEEGGSGLGLHIAWTTVRRHGGGIEVSSRPGRTVFTVMLPYRQPRSAS
jgi:signal transduction histidine kinase